MNRRLIEEEFPIKEISIIGQKEKHDRFGLLSGVHQWWAGRPQAVSRSVIASVLTMHSEDTKKNSRKINKIIELARNESNILEFNKQMKLDSIKFLDPFSGRGSHPFEAAKLGLEVYANDYNPVAVLILKCVIEYVSKFLKTPEINSNKVSENKFLADIKKWNKIILNDVKDELEGFYKTIVDEGTPIAHIWARTITCINPKCKMEIPLLSTYWLAKKSSNDTCLFPFYEKNKLNFKILKSKDIPKDFDPNEGTIKRAKVTCTNPTCGTTIKPDELKKFFKKEKQRDRLIAVISSKVGSGKNYRVAKKEDSDLIEQVEIALIEKNKVLSKRLGCSAIPHEEMPTTMTGCIAPPNYGLNSYGDLFNSRQKLALLTFVEKINDVHDQMLKENYDSEYAKAITTCLALEVDKIADFSSTLCILNPTGGRGIVHVFGRQALPMTWDYAESYPFNPEAASWFVATEKFEDWLSNNIHENFNGKVTSESAISLSYPDEFFDIIFTDPPYYNAIPYADLSDYFYVWLKRMIGNLHPELFSTPLTPKSEEITEMESWDSTRYHYKTKEFFQENMLKAINQCYRILKKDGVFVIVYAHKTTDGWETLINSLIQSGFIITASWPILTEMKGRLRATDSAALGSSIYMVCRKWKKEPHGEYSVVKKEMRQYLDKKLDFLWSEGIRGPDFFISAIGSSIEVFGKYEKITDNADNEIEVPQLLEDIRNIVTDYAIKKILHGKIGGEISTMTKFYVLWRSSYGQAKVPYDDARKLATSLGVPESELNKGFIIKEKGFVRVIGPEERSVEEIKDPRELIDILHKVLILWRKGEKALLEELLNDSGFTNNNTFRRVAQAILESLPKDVEERRWLEQYLTRFSENEKNDESQAKLF